MQTNWFFSVDRRIVFFLNTTFHHERNNHKRGVRSTISCFLATHLWNCPSQDWSLCDWAWRRCRPSCRGWRQRSPGRPRQCLSSRGGDRIAWRWPCRAPGPSLPLRCCPCGRSRAMRRTTSWGTTHSRSPPSTGGSSALLDVWRLPASCDQRRAR